MNKKWTKPAFKVLITYCALSLGACKTETDYPVDPTMQLIAAHEWKIKDIKVPGSTGADSIISKTCHTAGAHIFFSLNYQFSFADSTTGGCDSTIFPYDKGIWGLKIARDSLLFEGKVSKRAMKLVMVNNDSMQLRYLDSTVVSSPIRKTITFIK